MIINFMHINFIKRLGGYITVHKKSSLRPRIQAGSWGARTLPMNLILRFNGVVWQSEIWHDDTIQLDFDKNVDYYLRGLWRSCTFEA
jgi:hypothetical protein